MDSRVEVTPEEMIFTIEGEVVYRSRRNLKVELWTHHNVIYRKLFHINRNGVDFPDD